MMMTRTVRLSLATVLSVLGLSACGPRVTVAPHQLPEDPIPVKNAVWQQAWVDPQMVYSDSVFTLIRANRIDSFLVAPGKQQPELPDVSRSSTGGVGGAGAIRFQIASPNCRVSVSLSGLGVQLSPIRTTVLPSGYYKLTCDLSRTDPHQFPSGSYQLSAGFCGQNRSGILKRP